MALDLPHAGGEALGERDPPGGDAEEHQALGASGFFQDLVGDPGDRTADVGRVEDSLVAAGDYWACAHEK
jgi:hypothetical protein